MKQKFNWAKNCTDAYKLTQAVDLYISENKIESSDWDIKHDLDRNEFLAYRKIKGPCLELFATEQSADIKGEGIDSRYEVYDYSSYEEMGKDLLERLNWIIEMNKKGVLEKELDLELEKFKTERRHWLTKLCLGIGTLILGLIYFFLRK